MNKDKEGEGHRRAFDDAQGHPAQGLRRAAEKSQQRQQAAAHEAQAKASQNAQQRIGDGLPKGAGHRQLPQAAENGGRAGQQQG